MRMSSKFILHLLDYVFFDSLDKRNDLIAFLGRQGNLLAVISHTGSYKSKDHEQHILKTQALLVLKFRKTFFIYPTFLWHLLLPVFLGTQANNSKF